MFLFGKRKKEIKTSKGKTTISYVKIAGHRFVLPNPVEVDLDEFEGLDSNALSEYVFCKSFLKEDEEFYESKNKS